MVLIGLINPADNFLTNKGDRVPLGLLQISSYLKQNNFQTKIWDLNHDSLSELLQWVENEKPAFLGLSVSTPNYQQSLNIARNVKNANPHTQLIAGGNHITDIPSETLTVQTFDYAVVGEAEQVILEIVQGKVEKGIVIGKKVDLDTLPFPDYKGITLERYTMTVDGKKATTVITSRGCRYSCFYCGSSNSGWRGMSAERVVGELKYLYNLGYRAFYFADDIFSFDFKRVFDICYLILCSDLEDISWRATTRSNLLTQEMCHAMKRAGCEIISIGLESGSDEVLKAMNKLTTVVVQERGLEYCAHAGIKVKGFFIFPLPGETKETAEQTLAWAKDLMQKGWLQYCDMYVLTPYPSTPFWNNPEQYGIRIIYPKDSNWNEYFQTGIDQTFDVKIEHPNFTHQEIHEYIKRFQEEVKLPGLTYQ